MSEDIFNVNDEAELSQKISDSFYDEESLWKWIEKRNKKYWKYQR